MEQMKLDVTISDGNTAIKNILGPLTALVIGAFMVNMDSTAMNTLLPRLVTAFKGSYQNAQWVVTCYALAQASVIPLAGWLSDRFGAKRIYLLSIGMFTAGSILCSAAWGIGELSAFRAVQGLGGGMLLPITYTYIYRLSPPGKIGQVMGIMGIPILLAPALGPVLSGWLADDVSWRWIFLINFPVGVVGLLLGMRKLPALDRQISAAPDWLGMLLAPLAFSSLSFGLSEGGNDWGSPRALGGLIVGMAALAAFTVSQLRRANPLLELRVFGIGRFTRGIVALWLLQFTMFGTLFLIPQLLQNMKDMSALAAGIMLLPYAFAFGVCMQIGGRISDKYGVRWLTAAAMAVLACGDALLSRVTPDTGSAGILLPIALLGVSFGLCMMPLNGFLLRSVPPRFVSRVTPLTSAMQQVLISFAVAGLTSVLTSKTTFYASSLPRQTAYLHAFRDTFLAVALLAIAGIVLGLLIPNPKKKEEKQPGALTDAV